MPASKISPPPDPGRCAWCGSDPLYVAYHDHEWGVPEHDDRALFVKLTLDGFQAGLSWLTILRRREGILAAFDGLDPDRLARLTPAQQAALLQDRRIVRHRGKVAAAVGNAQATLRLRERGVGLSSFLWAHVGGRPINHRRRRKEDVPTSTRHSTAMSRALTDAGFRYCGPTICYAFMQATGMVNDHLVGCFRHPVITALQKSSPSLHAPPSPAGRARPRHLRARSEG